MGIYNREKRLKVALRNMDNLELSENNKQQIKDFLYFLSVNDISDSRQLKYLYPLEKIAGWLDKDFQDANRKDIESLIKNIDKQEFSTWTKQDYKITIKKFYSWLYNKNEPDIDEWETPKLVKFIKIKKPLESNKIPSDLLTPKDIKFLVGYAKDLREKALILTLYESGARIGELLNLKIKDVTFDEYGAQLNLFGKTGPRKIRIVGSAPAISQWLSNEHPRNQDKQAYLFCYVTGTKKGNQMSYAMAAKIFRNIKQRSGFDKPLNPHHFRHSRASELAEFLSDGIRCNFFGWVQGSQMSRIYTHIQDTDRVILELNGLIDKKKDENGQFAEVICPRCNTNNPFGSKFCSQCSMGLDKKSVMEYDSQKDKAAKLGFDMHKILDNKEFMMKLLNTMAIEWEELQNGK